MATRNQIIEAVGNRKIVTFTYKGKERTAELYYYGKHKDTNENEVRTYQLSGESESGEMGWKLFKTSSIKNLKSTKNEIGYQEDYKEDDKDFATLIAKVIVDKKVSKV